MQPIEFTAYLAGEDEDSRTTLAAVKPRKDSTLVTFELPRSERIAAQALWDLWGQGKILRVTVVEG